MLKEYRWLLWPAIIAFAAFVGAALLFAWSSSSPGIRFEVAKMLAQFVLTVVLGGMVTLAIQGYNRNRERSIVWNDYRKTFLTTLIRAYFNTKKARRILEANCLPSKGKPDEIIIPYDVYEKQMEVANDAQLELEFLIYELETFEHVFTKGTRNIVKKRLRLMETYLKGIIDEYHIPKESPEIGFKYIDLSVSNRLKEILAPSRIPGPEGEMVESQFRRRFINQFHKSVEMIRREILKL